MASDSLTADADRTEALLQSLVRGKRGEALRAQLTARYPEIWVEEIEEAIQYACKSFLSEAEGITGPGQVYTWIRTAALRYLNREADRRRREIPIDPVTMEKGRVVEEEAGPAEELIELEDDADLELLVGELSASLSDRQRDVLDLYGAGYKRPQIAERLGVRERIVKRDLLEIMEHGRATLGRLAGGGCERGEPLVMRLVFGISTPDESAAAREHLGRCGRCELFSERLIGWREKAGAMLPPAAEGASPGVVRQIANSAGEKVSALKQQVLDGGARRRDFPCPSRRVGERDPAWQSAMELMSAGAGDDDERLADAWERFAAEHPDAVVSFVGKLRAIRRMNEGGALLERLEGAMPPAAVEALVDALEHPARVHSIGGRDFDLRRDVVAKLAEIGDQRAAEALRRFADDPEIGQEAAEAVRAIEARVS